MAYLKTGKSSNLTSYHLPLASYLLLIASCLLFLGCSKGEDTNISPPKTSPITDTLSTEKKGNLEAGKAIYERYCFYCHGRKGRGDGAIAMAVTPRPANFVADRERMNKSDKELFISISEGVKRGEDAEIVMPAWKTVLSEKERWDVLAYVRYLAEKGKEQEVRGKRK